LFCLAFAAFFLELTGGAASSLLEIRQQSFLFAVVNVVRLVISLLLNFYLIVILHMGLLGYFIANLVTVAVSTSMFLVICFRSCGFGFDRELARGLMKFQYPLVSSSLVAWVGGQIEKVIVRYRIGIDGVGLLALAARFPILIGLLVMEPFMRSWNTKRTELAERDPANAGIVIGAMYSYFLFVLLFASLLVAVNADTLLRLIAPSEFWPAARFVRLYVLTGLLLASANYLNLGLFMAKATKALARIRTWVSVIGVVLSYVFITRWGLGGALYAGLICNLIHLPWTMMAAQRRFRIAVQVDKVVILVVSAAVLYVVIAHGPVEAVPGVERLERFLGSEVADWAAGTPLANVRDGAALKVIKNSGEDVALLMVKTVLCLSFGLLAAVVRSGTSFPAPRWLSLKRSIEN
jgi:O-antigen/teichoic acid export membrane protein